MDTRDLLKILTNNASVDKTGLISALANGDASSLLPFLMNAGKRGAGTGTEKGVRIDPSGVRLPDDSEIVSAMAKMSESSDVQ